MQQQPWKEYRAPDGKFTVQLPGEPSLKPAQDGSQEVSATLKADRNLLFFIRYKDHPAPLSSAEFEQKASQARDGLAFRQGNRLLGEKPVSLGKYPGREMRVLVGATGDVSIARAYAVGKRYYSLTAMVPQRNADAPEVARFMDSFQPNE